MKKIICPYCHQVLKVDEKMETVTCSHCEKDLNIAQVERIMQMDITRYFNYANAELYASTEYEKAAHNFMMVLSLDETIVDAVTGLALSVLYCSTLSESHLNDSLLVLSKYQNVLVDKVNVSTLATFLSVYDKSLDLYLKTLSVRTSVANTFISEISKENYLKTLNDVVKIKQFIVNNLLNDEVLNILNLDKKEYVKNIDKLEVLNKKKYHINDKLKVENSDQERIFSDKRSSYKSASIMLIMFIVSSLLFVIGLIVLLALWKYWYIGLSITLLGAISTTVFYFLRKSYKNKVLN